jgi:uncharacterized protein (DUF302 family)
MRQMMFTVHQSKLGFDETIAAVQKAAQKHGWQIPMVHDLQENYQQAGYEDMTRLKILYFCNPSGGYRILQDDENKPMSVMMPTGVSVYETRDGQVYIAGMNLERMSLMFGGVVKEVLQQGGANYVQAMAEVATPVEDQLKVDKKSCLVGCLSAAAVTAVLGGVVVTLLVKLFRWLMPKMMAKMMPEMMSAMEKAGVQPPCAQIVLEHLEAEKE